ncbi:MAG: NADP-dependent oxidoreductase [Actinomycetota bacterium]|nr:NADP-dependent oxidoreductase [Actinomycetota bacterium]
MRAVGIREFGGRDRLETMDVPEPKLGADGVLVRVHAAGVNPVDWKIREGRLDAGWPHVFPVVPGWDVAGTVERVGPAVTTVASGDEVYAYCRKHFVGEGAYAELVTVPETSVAHKPGSLDLEHAGAVPLCALTAYQALFFGAGLTAGETVLVQAAAGGVGSFAVQLAADAGAEVIGTASERNHEYVLGLGALEVVDYRAVDAVDAVREIAPEGVDVVLDVYGGEALRRSVDAVRDEGRIVSIGQPPTDEHFRQRRIEPSYVFVRPDAEQLAEIADMFDDDRLTVHLDEVLPLEQAARAHELSEAGHVRGKLVLRVA